MSDSNPSFLGRISLAVGTFFSILGNGEFAADVLRLRNGEKVGAAPAPAPAPTPAPAAAPAPAPAPAPQPAPVLKEATPDAALQLLGLLQRDARLIDFVEEDIKNYSDADIGAAARLVHDGCRATLREHFTIRPVRDEAEGSRVTLAEGFDAASIRLTGNVVGKAPFNGSISHRGWRVEEDIKSYSDADIGAAARLVHDGCRATLREHFTIRPVRDEAEGSRVTLPEGFDASSVRLTGNVVGKAPFSGSISHRGWRVDEVRLPKLADSHNAKVIAPAEVEL